MKRDRSCTAAGEPVERHSREMRANRDCWDQKPVLRGIYRRFHERIARHLPDRAGGSVVELGSGIPDIREVIPGCIRTDLFASPWIDRVENAYALSFTDRSVACLILFDVFHHLRYPGTALREWRRVLRPGGRLIVFEPCLSVVGLVVYGLLHGEPLEPPRPRQWFAPTGWSPDQIDYFAAQGTATRLFVRPDGARIGRGWRIAALERFSALSYLASGGYSGPCLYPGGALPALQALEKVLDRFPAIFATRLLAVVEKTR